MDTLGENITLSPEGDSPPNCQCHLPPDKLYQAAATNRHQLSYVSTGCQPAFLFPLKLSAIVL